MHEAHSVKRKKHIDLVRSFPRMCSSNFLPLPVFSKVGKLFNIFLYFICLVVSVLIIKLVVLDIIKFVYNRIVLGIVNY